MIQDGGRCVQSAVVTKSTKKLTNISVGDQSPNTVTHFQMKEFGKENMNLI
jgi:hypothetical protein